MREQNQIQKNGNLGGIVGHVLLLDAGLQSIHRFGLTQDLWTEPNTSARRDNDVTKTRQQVRNHLCSESQQDVHAVDLVSWNQGQIHLDQLDDIGFGNPQRSLQSVT